MNFSCCSHFCVHLTASLCMYSQDANIHIHIYVWSHRLTWTETSVFISTHRNTKSTETDRNTTGSHILFLHLNWSEQEFARSDTGSNMHIHVLPPPSRFWPESWTPAPTPCRCCHPVTNGPFSSSWPLTSTCSPGSLYQYSLVVTHVLTLDRGHT